MDRDRRRERNAERLVWVTVGVWIALLTFSLIDPTKHPVPPGIYGLLTIAFGYYFGARLMEGRKDDG